jgi:hypothetical protein
MRHLSLLASSALILLAAASPARAQAEPPAGVRAAGMAGAFVGVADDASAVYWNPAGLASGSFFSLVLDRSSLGPGDDSPFPGRRSAVLVAIGTPALGISYARMATPVTVATDAAGGSRNTAQFIPRDDLVTHQFGVTALQSLRDGLAVGATLKAVRGRTSVASRTTVDADIGVMASGALGKIGLAVRNLLEPEFDAAGGRAQLQRRVRGGFSLLVRQAVTVAVDSDFTTADTPRGRWRDAAIGAEAHPIPRAWLRGGVHWNTAGGDVGAAPVAAIGASAAVYGSIVADGQVSVGSRDGDRGWGVGLRFVF